MKITVLTDNTPQGVLGGEWGLSFWIEADGKQFLFDTGKSDLFAKNAEALGIDLREADFAALSHAHYDHADGMDAFFRINSRAPFYLRAGTGEDCYSRHGLFPKYIGIRRGTLGAWRERIVFADGVFSLTENIYLLPHRKDEAERAEIGRRARLFRRRGLRLLPDDFSHEQTLVVREESGLVIFASCSHAGADRILREVRDAFPGESVAAYLGGLHLFRSTDGEVRDFAARVRETGIRRLVTGHCTGDRALAILREELGGAVESFFSGYSLNL